MEMVQPAAELCTTDDTHVSPVVQTIFHQLYSLFIESLSHQPGYKPIMGYPFTQDLHHEIPLIFLLFPFRLFTLLLVRA